jgi:hypothetical protein
MESDSEGAFDLQNDERRQADDLLDAVLRTQGWDDSSNADSTSLTDAERSVTTPNAQLIEADLAKQRIYDSIRAGRPLSCDIYDEDGHFLLGAGSLVTADFVQMLRDAGILNIQFRQPDPQRDPDEIFDPSVRPSPNDLQTPRSRELDDRLAGGLLTPVTTRSIPSWRRPWTS